MLMPKKVKFRKSQRGRMRGRASRGAELSFGEFGLQALEPCWLTARQLEAGRVTITRFMKRRGKLWVRSFPWKPVTKKPTEVRMGKGKGDPEFWVDVIRPGKIIYELEGITEAVAKEAMTLAARKLPIKTRFISRESRELR
ncbi:MAG: 50S ribosomal protein L16 [Candidatus Aminicenantes bacterium RBG_16_63_16]|nr:MAG: 50S ribosomal protein L16 [Candidatus Aminicenantes bacterium RBG_16_63_16]